MDNTSPIQESSTDSKPILAKTPTLKHLLIALAVPLVIFLVGVFLLSVAALLGLIVIIVAIAITAGMLMVALRITYQKNLDNEPAQWKTKTFPLTSLILIVGLSTLIFLVFAR